MTTTKCHKCKQNLEESVYFYNGKNHTTCFSCAEKRPFGILKRSTFLNPFFENKM